MATEPRDGGTDASTNTYRTLEVDSACPMAGAKNPALLCVTSAMVSSGSAFTESAIRFAISGPEGGSRTATSRRFGRSTTLARSRRTVRTGSHVDGPTDGLWTRTKCTGRFFRSPVRSVMPDHGSYHQGRRTTGGANRTPHRTSTCVGSGCRPDG